MTDSTRETAVSAAEADPAEIGGLPCACRFHGVEGAIRHGSEKGELVDPDEPIHECDLHKALRERVALNAAEIRTLRNAGVAATDRAEASEAHAAELAKALERARAKDEVVRLSRCCVVGWKDARADLAIALGKLDALDQEDGT